MSDAHDLIGDIEERIEELAEAAERSRKLVLAGRIAAWGGAALVVVTLTGILGLPPTALVVGLAGALGGFAMAGSSSSSLDQTLAEIADLERKRSEAIDGIGLRVIPGGRA
ncbi:hypothetical protein [Salinarimonas soli]|uniref:Uncharacterized protein n=1 Tax=Salinarimonas soli TaxID=1638099 RepID=A0A5B2VI06_9HYPH|nr:hypothetical protein [Salinarimonas soli]KAA2237982.1 hypothetical protein F0L46_06835 [Salinarimonas soli]